MGRVYLRTRRAWTPRLWPLIVVAFVVTTPISLALRSFDWPVIAGAAVVIGFVIAQVRWTIWRRRHPMVTPDEWMADMRRAAPWN